jgi:tetratricopeptide (TPR) repeat protein
MRGALGLIARGLAALGLAVPGPEKRARQDIDRQLVAGEWAVLSEEVMSLYQKGQYDRAVVVAKKALNVAEKAGGSNHPSVAVSLNNLALLYQAQGQYAQAEPLCTRSLAIREDTLGPNHSDVATSLENMAELYRQSGRAKEAELLATRAAHIRAIKP